ncbi:MAG: hypothetical protein HON55_00985 [Legionellales bacterium]|jgi:hypothetical protein|nr:hypothetical protein [Legionellales bacterium]
MSEFSITIKDQINEFKSTFRREMPRHIKEHIDIDILDIKRKSIQQYSDNNLYDKAHEIINYLENKVEEIDYHNGIDEFINQIKHTLNEYAHYEETIVHKNRYSSEVLIRAIQIITLEKITLNYEYFIKLKECCKIIIELGNELHYEKLLLAMEYHYKSNPVFFDKILRHCKQLKNTY